jgi:hypothetical protein
MAGWVVVVHVILSVSGWWMCRSCCAVIGMSSWWCCPLGAVVVGVLLHIGPIPAVPPPGVPPAPPPCCPSLPLVVLSHPSSCASLSLPPCEQLHTAVLRVLGTVAVVAVLFSSLTILLSWFSIPVLVASMGLVLVFIIHVTS